MTTNACTVESREVRDFDRVVLRVYNLLNEVQIVQGERESLSIEARPEVLAKIATAVSGQELTIWLEGSLLDKLQFALATSLTRPIVRYHLTVKDLSRLELTGFVRANLPELSASNLGLVLKGAGEITIGSLAAQHVAVDLSGASRIELRGQVEEQDVAIEGPGLYEAFGLKSQRAKVCLKGLGRARVWAVDELEIKVRGLGQVEIRGKPVIKRDISPRIPLPSPGPP